MFPVSRYLVVCEKFGNRPLAYIDDDRGTGEWVKVTAAPGSTSQIVIDDHDDPDRAKWLLPDAVVSETFSTTGRTTWTIRCDTCDGRPTHADLSSEVLHGIVDDLAAASGVLEVLCLDDPDDVDVTPVHVSAPGCDDAAVVHASYRARHVIPLGVLCLRLSRFRR